MVNISCTIVNMSHAILRQVLNVSGSASDSHGNPVQPWVEAINISSNPAQSLWRVGIDTQGASILDVSWSIDGRLLQCTVAKREGAPEDDYASFCLVLRADSGAKVMKVPGAGLATFATGGSR